MKEYNEAGIRQEYRRLTETLIDRGKTITLMESATAGQIASLITDTEGASSIIKGALITYSNEAKVMCGVPAEVIDTYSVYSKETASEMALACERIFGADIGIGVTGTMGNADPENAADSVPGEVYFAIAMTGTVSTYAIKIPPQPSRLMYKLAVAAEIADALWALLLCD